MKLAEVFPSNYLKADDLQGRRPSVIIKDAMMELLGKDQKLILYFEGKEKGMVCNKTNAGRISDMYGDDTEGWIGKEIILCSEFVEYQGKSMKGLRVQPPGNSPLRQAPVTPQRAAPVYTETNPPPHDDIPF